MAKANELADLSIPAYYAPWWNRIEKSGHGILVRVDDPNHPEGSGVYIEKILSAGDIHDAFDATATKYLCCEDAMREDGYGFGCVNDADLILQWAVFGEIIYG